MIHQIFKQTMSREAQKVYADTCAAMLAKIGQYEVPIESQRDGYHLARLLQSSDHVKHIAEIHIFKNYIRLIKAKTTGFSFDVTIIDHVGLT